MRSSTNVIKSENLKTTSCWAPAELENRIPVSSDTGSSQNPHSEIDSQTSQHDQLSNIEREAEAIREAAFQQGYQEGLEKGGESLAGGIQALNGICSEMEAFRDSLFSSREEQILSVVLQIVEKLFGEGYCVDQETLQNVLAEAVQRAKPLGDLRCHLNPQDKKQIGDEWVAKQEVFFGLKLTMVPDDTIKPGGCFIEGLYGSVDARINTRIDLLKDAVKQVSQPAKEV